MEPEFLSLDEVLEIHEQQIDRYGGTYATRSRAIGSEQLHELVDREIRVANDGAQQGLLDRPAGMNGHHGPRLCFGMNQDEVAASLPVLDESGAFERPDHLSRGQRRERGHESSGNGNRHPSLERWSFLGNRFPMVRQAFQV